MAGEGSQSGQELNRIWVPMLLWLSSIHHLPQTPLALPCIYGEDDLMG